MYAGAARYRRRARPRLSRVIIAWSLAGAAHGLATGLRTSRSAGFARRWRRWRLFRRNKAVAEWFRRERSNRHGIINAGTALAPSCHPSSRDLLYADWRGPSSRARGACCGPRGGGRTISSGDHRGLSAAERAIIATCRRHRRRSTADDTWSASAFSEVGACHGKFMTETPDFYLFWLRKLVDARARREAGRLLRCFYAAAGIEA